MILPNNRSARDYSSFVDEALLELFSSRRIIQVVDAPFVVSKIALSLDNGLVIENDYGVCKTLSSRIKKNLRKVDFVANAEKSIWEPAQSIVLLGLCWNSLNGTICITERRLNKIFDHIQNIRNNFTSCPRDNLQAK